MNLIKLKHQNFYFIPLFYFVFFIFLVSCESNTKVKSSTELDVSEYTMEEIPENYAMDLATETINLRNVSTRSNKYNLITIADKAYMLINGKFEALSNTYVCENCDNKIVSTYQNAKYRVKINASFTQDPNCPLEGGCLDINGKLTVTDINTSETLTFNIWGEG
jgi:hypothetical protein